MGGFQGYFRDKQCNNWRCARAVRKRPERLPKKSFCILVGIYCHNIPACTPHSGYHGVTKVAKTADIAKMAEYRINCISARPTLPHITTPRSRDPKTLFQLKSKKNQMINDFQHKKGGYIFDPHPTPPQKSGFQVGEVWGASDQKLIGGGCLLDKIMILQGVQPVEQFNPFNPPTPPPYPGIPFWGFGGGGISWCIAAAVCGFGPGS